MRLKSFHGATLSDAMRQVRETLGDNAIIVTTRDDEMGGVRVTAAIDDAIKEAPPPSTEIEESGALESVASALVKHQVPTVIAEKLLATATQTADDDPIIGLSAALDAHFTFQPISDEKTDRPIVFIGAPGVGKTLCTAKYATKAALAKKLVMPITTDTERAGGIEQLAAFTRLLNVDLVEVEDAHALRDMLEMKNKAAFAIVDTPGRNPFNTSERQQIQSLVKACNGETVLVMPAGLDSSEAVDMALAFKEAGATSLLFTRLDMTRRLGSLLRVAAETGLPFANFSLSHKVVEPPHPFTPVTLSYLLLPQQAAAEKKAAGSRS